MRRIIALVGLCCGLLAWAGEIEAKGLTLARIIHEIEVYNSWCEPGKKMFGEASIDDEDWQNVLDPALTLVSLPSGDQVMIWVYPSQVHREFEEIFEYSDLLAVAYNCGLMQPEAWSINAPIYTAYKRWENNVIDWGPEPLQTFVFRQAINRFREYKAEDRNDRDYKRGVDAAVKVFRSACKTFLGRMLKERITQHIVSTVPVEDQPAVWEKVPAIWGQQWDVRKAEPEYEEPEDYRIRRKTIIDYI